MNWTKELPKEEGFYWYREEDFRERMGEPAIVVFENSAEGGIIYFCGNEIGRGGWWKTEIVGEFWPEKLTPP
jgi:hypothetical protein